MKIVAALEDIKQAISTERSQLIQKRAQLHEDLRRGADFFCASKQYSKSELERASRRMVEITRSLAAIDKEIFDLDIVIGTKFEVLLSDCRVKIETVGKKNDMGEITSSSSFFVDMCAEEEKVEVSPEDLWILKILKPALKYCNIEAVPKKS